jgi:hypothetical protein
MSDSPITIESKVDDAPHVTSEYDEGESDGHSVESETVPIKEKVPVSTDLALRGSVVPTELIYEHKSSLFTIHKGHGRERKVVTCSSEVIRTYEGPWILYQEPANRFMGTMSVAEARVYVESYPALEIVDDGHVIRLPVFISSPLGAPDELDIDRDIRSVAPGNGRVVGHDSPEYSRLMVLLEEYLTNPPHKNALRDFDLPEYLRTDARCAALVSIVSTKYAGIGLEGFLNALRDTANTPFKLALATVKGLKYADPFALAEPTGTEYLVKSLTSIVRASDASEDLKQVLCEELDKPDTFRTLWFGIRRAAKTLHTYTSVRVLLKDPAQKRLVYALEAQSGAPQRRQSEYDNGYDSGYAGVPMRTIRSSRQDDNPRNTRGERVEGKGGRGHGGKGGGKGKGGKGGHGGKGGGDAFNRARGDGNVGVGRYAGSSGFRGDIRREY